MHKPFLTLDTVDVAGKVVLLRVDINSPVDPSTGKVLDNERIDEAVATIKLLQEKQAKIVCIAHQGRPGERDFTTLAPHAKLLAAKLGAPVRFFDQIFGSQVTDRIKSLNDREVLLLENVRFSSEESLDLSSEAHAESYLIRGLESSVDVVVNDAFSVCHRSHASIMGFTRVPFVAGPHLIAEVDAITKAIENTKRPFILVLGGVKIDDYFGLVETFLKENRVDHILVGGFMADLALRARGFNLGKEQEKLAGKDAAKHGKISDLLPMAKRFFEGYSDKFIIPVDVAVDHGGKREEIETKQLPSEFDIKDLGSKTIEKYKEIIASAGTIFFKGPMGFYEYDEFSVGSKEIIAAIADSSAYSFAGGGNTNDVIRHFHKQDGFSYMSTAGGATLKMMEKGSLVGFQPLEQSYERHTH